MPIVRLSRDKRGLDTLYLIDTRPDERRSGGARVLYFWTAPPGLRVGRGALDESRQRELERMHPDLTFDWPELVKAAEAARQQAAAVLTPEARRDAWRGAGRPSKGGPRQSAKASEAEPVVMAAAATPVAQAAPSADTARPAAADLQTSDLPDAPAPRARRRRRRTQRPGDSNETPQPADPIIDS